MRNKLFGPVLAASLALAAQPSAHADDDGASLRVGGFGTLGATYHASEGIEYRRSLDQPHGSRGGKLDFGVDSALGAQVNVRANEQLEAVVQAVSRQYPDNTWNPRITWGFLSYSPDESLTLRLGRLGLDTQLNADSRLIGYSYLPVRPAPEYMGTIPVDSFDGADASFRYPLGPGLVMLKAYYGEMTGKIFAAGRQTEILGVSGGGLMAGYTVGGLQLRVVAGMVKLQDNGDLQPLLDALRSTPFAQGAAAAARLDNRGRRVQFGAVDVAYEDGPLKLQASYFREDVARDTALLPNVRATSLLAGYRFGAFTPYATFARVKSSPMNFSTGLPPFPGLIELDQAATAVVQGNQFNQRSLGAGVRYDFAQNYALKFQVEHVRADASPIVQDVRVPPRDSKRLNLFSLALDFVF